MAKTAAPADNPEREAFIARSADPRQAGLDYDVMDATLNNDAAAVARACEAGGDPRARVDGAPAIDFAIMLDLNACAEAMLPHCRVEDKRWARKAADHARRMQNPEFAALVESAALAFKEKAALEALRPRRRAAGAVASPKPAARL